MWRWLGLVLLCLSGLTTTPALAVMATVPLPLQVVVEICITVGKPKEGDPARAVELPVHFTLALSPYDEFRIWLKITSRY